MKFYGLGTFTLTLLSYSFLVTAVACTTQLCHKQKIAYSSKDFVNQIFCKNSVFQSSLFHKVPKVAEFFSNVQGLQRLQLPTVRLKSHTTGETEN